MADLEIVINDAQAKAALDRLDKMHEALLASVQRSIEAYAQLDAGLASVATASTSTSTAVSTLSKQLLDQNTAFVTSSKALVDAVERISLVGEKVGLAATNVMTLKSALGDGFKSMGATVAAATKDMVAQLESLHLSMVGVRNESVMLNSALRAGTATLASKLQGTTAAIAAQTKELLPAIQQITTAVGSLQRTMQSLQGVSVGQQLKTNLVGASGAVAQLGASFNTATAAGNQFTNMTRGMIRGLGTFRTAMLQLGAGFTIGYAIRRVVEDIAQFEDRMVRFQAVVRAAPATLARVRKEVLELGVANRYGATQTAEALLELAKAGLTTQQSMAALGPTLSLAVNGMLSMQESADILAATMRQFNLSAEDTSRVGDVLVKVAQATTTDIKGLTQAMKFAGPPAAALRLSFEETAAALGIMGNAGVRTSLAGTSLRGVMLSLADVTKDATKALARMGLDVSDVNLESHKLVETMERLDEANLGVTDATEIAQRRFAGMLLILSKYSSAFRDLIEQTVDATNVSKENQDIIDNSLMGAYKRMQGALLAFSVSMGDQGVLGALRSFVDGVRGVLLVFGGFGKELGASRAKYEAWASVVKAIGTVALVAVISKMAMWTASLIANARAAVMTIGAQRALRVAMQQEAVEAERIALITQTQTTTLDRLTVAKLRVAAASKTMQAAQVGVSTAMSTAMSVLNAATLVVGGLAIAYIALEKYLNRAKHAQEALQKSYKESLPTAKDFTDVQIDLAQARAKLASDDRATKEAGYTEAKTGLEGYVGLLKQAYEGIQRASAATRELQTAEANLKAEQEKGAQASEKRLKLFEAQVATAQANAKDQKVTLIFDPESEIKDTLRSLEIFRDEVLQKLDQDFPAIGARIRKLRDTLQKDVKEAFEQKRLAEAKLQAFKDKGSFVYTVLPGRRGDEARARFAELLKGAQEAADKILQLDQDFAKRYETFYLHVLKHPEEAEAALQQFVEGLDTKGVRFKVRIAGFKIEEDPTAKQARDNADSQLRELFSELEQARRGASLSASEFERLKLSEKITGLQKTVQDEFERDLQAKEAQLLAKKAELARVLQPATSTGTFNPAALAVLTAEIALIGRATQAAREQNKEKAASANADREKALRDHDAAEAAKKRRQADERAAQAAQQKSEAINKLFATEKEELEQAQLNLDLLQQGISVADKVSDAKLRVELATKAAGSANVLFSLALSAATVEMRHQRRVAEENAEAIQKQNKAYDEGKEALAEYLRALAERLQLESKPTVQSTELQKLNAKWAELSRRLKKAGLDTSYLNDMVEDANKKIAEQSQRHDDLVDKLHESERAVRSFTEALADQVAQGAEVAGEVDAIAESTKALREFQATASSRRAVADYLKNTGLDKLPEELEKSRAILDQFNMDVAEIAFKEGQLTQFVSGVDSAISNTIDGMIDDISNFSELARKFYTDLKREFGSALITRPISELTQSGIRDLGRGIGIGSPQSEIDKYKEGGEKFLEAKKAQEALAKTEEVRLNGLRESVAKLMEAEQATAKAMVLTSERLLEAANVLMGVQAMPMQAPQLPVQKSIGMNNDKDLGLLGVSAKQAALELAKLGVTSAALVAQQQQQFLEMAALGAKVAGTAFLGTAPAKAHGYVEKYAQGGVIDRPEYFGMSGGRTGLRGEAGPEVLMPAKQMSGGDYGVKVELPEGSGAAQNVVVHLHGVKDFNSFRENERQFAQRMGRAVRRQ